MSEKAEESKYSQNTAHKTEPAARSIVFLGGMNYDEARNIESGKMLMELLGYNLVITLGEESSNPKNDDTVIFEYADGIQQELPTKLAMKQLDDDAVQRYTKLHERRARELIARIESSSAGPVDAVFQSVDTSTGILAMHERPDLFRRVVLLDPSSIVKHPTPKKFFRDLVSTGRIRTLFSRKDLPTSSRYETPLNRYQHLQRMKKTARFGNMRATYLSYQAKMLHEIASAKNAPMISVIASEFDHAYSPEHILESLQDVTDIATLFVSHARHGIGGKISKIQEVPANFVGPN